jgi:hypothetical protein
VAAHPSPEAIEEAGFAATGFGRGASGVAAIAATRDSRSGGGRGSNRRSVGPGHKRRGHQQKCIHGTSPPFGAGDAEQFGDSRPGIRSSTDATEPERNAAGAKVA